MFSYSDRIELTVSAGDGGSGALSFIRTRKQARGGPDGGDGGDGGSFFVAGDQRVSGFQHLKKRKLYQAEQGQEGGKQMKTGKKGKDFILPLPLGTVIRDRRGPILKDLTAPSQELLLKGARGGRGNGFYKNSRDQAPRRFQKGLKGASLKVTLELKPLIHIALLGKPNAGKSSFFQLATGAKSPSAPYPYTTLRPYIAPLKDFPENRWVLDLPGLGKGASQSDGRGLVFLRSLQRAKILLCFIDSGSQTPLKDKREIEKELQTFDRQNKDCGFEPLSHKKKLFILSKTDQIQKPGKLAGLIQSLRPHLNRGEELLPLSNSSKKGLKALLSALFQAL